MAGLSNDRSHIGSKPTNSRRQPEPTIPIKKSQLDKLLNGFSNNRNQVNQGQVLNHLLNEKDSTGDLKAKISKLEGTVDRLNDKIEDRDIRIADAKEQVHSLNNELTILKAEAARNKKSRFDKVMDGIMEKPENLPQLIQSCQGFLNSIKSKDNLTSTTPISGVDNNEQEPDEEIEKSIDIALDELQALYPDVPLDKLLTAITELIKTNKAFADMKLKELLRND